MICFIILLILFVYLEYIIYWFKSSEMCDLLVISKIGMISMLINIDAMVATHLGSTIAFEKIAHTVNIEAEKINIKR